MNILLHSIVTLLVALVAKQVTKDSRHVSLISGLIFALHPIHTEAVSGLVGRAELLSALFYLISLLAYLHHIHLRDICGKWQCWLSLTISLFASLLAMLAKEQGLTVLGVVLIYDVLLKTRLSYKNLSNLTQVSPIKWP